MIIFSNGAKADMGPKPSITVYVKNFNSQSYYLDLLVNEKNYAIKFDDFNDRKYSPELKNLNLYKYNKDGWIAAHIRNWLLFGDLHGKYDKEKNMMVHYFTYHGVPETFKIITENEKGEIVVSNEITPHQFRAEVIFDMSTGKVIKISSPFRTYDFKYFIFLIIFTVIIELLISIPFKIKPKKVVVYVNIFTQLLLQASILAAFKLYSFKASYVVFYIEELAIVFIEYFLYRAYTKPLNKKVLAFYTVLSNLVTFLIGILIS
ncbi:hypothetical protein SAMN05443428_11332 [Caloramator quimbayensis]|uniref:Uncharacterized protein n=1 Tax=Caloramator quimbayensis TaxID=1147123 RepID=A0A1T4XTS9_9CLOT|nr:hypothetical protein [Caloramator quimbayensis]SKA92979.1 hypothetical protein SAMN05443428_11332 [Caloramator quimbayensis]